MWISRKRFEALEHKVKDLESGIKGAIGLSERVCYLESQTAPFRVSDPSTSIYVSLYPDFDRRQKVSMHEAVNLIMAHLKLKFTKKDAVPERIELEKAK